MSKVFEWIKKHPFETGIGVFGVGALIVLYASSGSSAASSTSTSATDPNADALAASEYQTQAGLQATSISAGVQNNATAASVTNNTTDAGVQENADNLSAQTSQVIAGLEAGVQNNSTNATLTSSLAQTSALTEIALAPYQVEEDQLNSTANATLTSLEGTVTGLETQISGLSSTENIHGAQLGALLSGSPVPSATSLGASGG